MIVLCRVREAFWWWLDRVLLAAASAFILSRRYRAQADRVRREKREIAG